MMDNNLDDLNELMNKMEKREKIFESLDKMRKIAKASDVMHGLSKQIKELGTDKLAELAEDGKFDEGMEIVYKYSELVDKTFEELLYVLFN